ncbi:MAG: guanylate kinase [Thermodesulfovibrio sp.]|nr:guanylate kinase [Thermodesulfovibrio sp.]
MKLIKKTMNKEIIFIISAPSGTGKTTICKELVKLVSNLKMSISYTTRQPRQGEKNGIDYYFVDRETFQSMLKNNEFIEWAEVYGNLYGTSKKVIEDLLQSGVDILMDIDTQGAKNIKERFNNSVLIFLIPPSLNELKRRLIQRGEQEETIKYRLMKALEEISMYEIYDYVVENREIEETLRKIICIINAERLKISRNREKIEKLRREY